MTKLEKLYQLAYDDNIPIDKNIPDTIKSIAVKFDDGQKVIGFSGEVDENKTELEMLAHEMGHCKKEAFYHPYAHKNMISQCEHSANIWAVNYIIPFNSLCAAVEKGIREIWDIAEYFGVSEEFVIKAIEIYKSNGKEVPKEYYLEEF